jgi:hypothetical protein
MTGYGLGDSSVEVTGVIACTGKQQILRLRRRMTIPNDKFS